MSLRRHFHANPEISLQEKETSAFVEKYLQRLGLETNRIGDYGITTMIWSDNPQAKTIAVRCEMDALPVTEENEFPWKSQHEGVMHACGHDGIIAAGLVLAKICQTHQNQLPINVKFIFQPAEENGKGTHIMLNGGVMENPQVDYFLMFHYANDAYSGVEYSKYPSSATVGNINIKINGHSTHWGLYNQEVDSINAARQVLQVIHDLNNDFKSKAPFIMGISKINGGTSRNVVAKTTLLEGALRAANSEDYFQLRQRLFDELAQISQQSLVTIETELTDKPTPPIISDGDLVDLADQVGKEIWSDDARLVKNDYLNADTASYYFNYAKGIFLVFTAKKPDQFSYPFHNGKFDFNEDILWKSVMMIHQFILKMRK